MNGIGMVFRPQAIMAEVVKHTHYLPDHWRGRTHRYEVKEEFGRMYRQRVLIFIGEVLSVLLTPAILCFSLPLSAESIVSFVEKYTTKVTHPLLYVTGAHANVLMVR
jgi:autophagy-related protein 9